MLIPFGENHLRRILQEGRSHYNRGRLHAGLGPGFSDPPPGISALALTGHRLLIDPGNLTAKIAKIAKTGQPSPIQKIIKIEIFRAVYPSDFPSAV